MSWEIYEAKTRKHVCIAETNEIAQTIRAGLIEVVENAQELDFKIRTKP